MDTIADVVNALRNKFSNSMLNQAVRIFTPFSQKIKLARLGISEVAKEFIAKYEPRAAKEGLFLHQYRLLEAYRNGAQNFILTSSTGSGKSLCFWAWIMDVLAKEERATALACFPTQALMWGQAERLAKISDPSSLTVRDRAVGIAYSGVIRVAGKEIGWTVWKGTGGGYVQDTAMREHEASQEFQQARIRIATLDKAHYSLIQAHPEFTMHLKCMVLDEAHQYDGIFGANVAYFLKRLYVAKTSAGKTIPNMFLASATLADAKSFAAKLISLPEKFIYHERDAVEAEIQVVPLTEVEHILTNPQKNGLTRVALFNDSLVDKSHFAQVLDDEAIMGSKLNLLYFADAKFGSRLKKRDLDLKMKRRSTLIYDADLPNKERRLVESEFNCENIIGATLIATSALELGVDIENLDVCVLQSVPPKRADLLQRIGRVGRRQEKPGLVLISLSAAPLDRYIASSIESAFRFDNARSIPIPTELEILKLKNIAAIQQEMWHKQGKKWTSDYCQQWSDYEDALETFFGEPLKYSQVREQIQARYGQLMDTSDHFWTHAGFRASAARGKVPIRVENSRNDDVAWIEDINIFRDAHPEAIYLDDKGRRWRVVAYDGKWREAEWEHPDSDVVLAKYLKGIDVVYVRAETEQVATRGLWDETFKPYQLFSDPPIGVAFPAHGEIDYGIWEYSRKFNGYKQVSLSKKTTKKVSLNEVSNRFKEAIGQGTPFPFLFPLTYRTYGWSWDCSEAICEYDAAFLEDISDLVHAIVEPFIADAIQTSPGDVRAELSLAKGALEILDASPGGNGLSEGLLRCGGIPMALQNCRDVLQQFAGEKNKEKYQRYVMELCQEVATYDAEQVIDIVGKLQSHWGR